MSGSRPTTGTCCPATTAASRPPSDPVSQPLKDLYADLTISPNQRIGFHADARYNVYDLGLREANADVRLVYPRFAVAVGPRFNEQGGSR